MDIIIRELREKRARAHDEAKALAEVAANENRALTADEEARFQSLTNVIDSLDKRITGLREHEQRADASAARMAELDGGAVENQAAQHPLTVSAAYLDNVQQSLRGGITDVAKMGDVETRTALTTSTLGARATWAASTLDGPRLLHMAAGVRQIMGDSVAAEFPKLTNPSAAAGVGEGVSLAEFDSSTGGTATLLRRGRYTDFSEESRASADAGIVLDVHRLAVAKDLDDNLITAVEADAGTAVTFSADVPAAIRKALATVMDATAASDVSNLVVLANPADVALLEDVTPVGGRSIGEAFSLFSGALVYPSSAVTAGFMSVANLKVGAVYLEARGLQTSTDVDVKTAVVTAATSVISGYATGIVSGYASKVDVVTP